MFVVITANHTTTILLCSPVGARDLQMSTKNLPLTQATQVTRLPALKDRGGATTSQVTHSQVHEPMAAEGPI